MPAGGQPILSPIESLTQPGADGVEGGAGCEDRGHALCLQDRDVVLGNDPPHNDQDVVAAHIGQELDDPRDQGEVCAGEEGQPHRVGVFLHDRLDDLLGGLMEPGVDHFEAAVA